MSVAALARRRRPALPGAVGVDAAARHRARARRRDDRVARALAAARRVLPARRRAVDGASSAAPGSRATSARATARHRPARTGSARRCTASRRIPASVRVPPARLRRLVGRGLELAGLQHVPPRRVRHAAAVRRRQRGALAHLAAVPLLRRDRVQRAPGRAGSRICDLPPREHRRTRPRAASACRRPSSCACFAGSGRLRSR